MPVKKYGIYVVYPPTVNLRGQGLGRHLAAFLKASVHSERYRFVIACPSWTREGLVELCRDEGVELDSFDLICPQKAPFLLRLYNFIVKLRPSKKARRLSSRPIKSWLVASEKRLSDGHWFLVRRLADIRNPLLWLLFLSVYLIFSVPMGAIFLFFKFVELPVDGFHAFYGQLARAIAFAKRHKRKRFLSTLHAIVTAPKNSRFIVTLYRHMVEREAAVLNRLINNSDDVAAWYAPTAFCEHFSGVQGPRLTCVPDVVLGDFPVGFAVVGDDRMVDNFREVERTIRASDHFVTYSEHLKQNTLVHRYEIDPRQIHVIPHGHNSLDDLLPDAGKGSVESRFNEAYLAHFRAALEKAVNYPAPGPTGEHFPYLFYASQFRPNKNVMTLLRAYTHLLRERFVGHRLVLTGNPKYYDEIAEFVSENQLSRDVLFLSGLSAKELAVCYSLAELAVNPSLFEGGCPFTLTEAVSVGTPVVMGKIPVTEEVVTDSELREMMLFDPYDYRNMAMKIHWALDNREVLYEKQRRFYSEVLINRAWRNVVDDYVEILNNISH